MCWLALILWLAVGALSLLPQFQRGHRTSSAHRSTSVVANADSLPASFKTARGAFPVRTSIPNAVGSARSLTSLA